MGLSKVLKGSQIRPAWRYPAGRFLWQIVPDEGSHIIGEVRDIERKRTSFFCLESTSGRICWEHMRLEEDWWIGIETARNSLLFLHGYVTPNLPGHRGIIAVDLLDGTKLWSNRDVTFVSLEGDDIIASNWTVDGPAFLRIDARTGMILGTVENRQQTASLRKPPVTADMTVPVPLSEQPEEDVRVRQLLQLHCGPAIAIGPVEYVNHPRAFVFSYYEQSDRREGEKVLLRKILKVLDPTGTILLLQEPLSDGNPVPVPNSFFLLGDVLYYIWERQTLTAVPLWVN